VTRSEENQSSSQGYGRSVSALRLERYGRELVTVLTDLERVVDGTPGHSILPSVVRSRSTRRVESEHEANAIHLDRSRRSMRKVQEVFLEAPAQRRA